jgi:preprotein translocase subunit SecA
MKESIERYVQRDLNYAIVDEVDSILIDEARTPLIISGSAEQSADLYQKVDAIIPGLRKDIDYTVDEKAHSAILTDNGIERVEQRLGVGNLYNPANIEWLHHVTQALTAHTLYKRDVNYLIDDGQIIIVDEFTGRKMPGRRWSTACTRRSRPRRASRSRREPDPRDHQLPELLPPLQEAGRHDRHRRHRGRGVPQDLQARRHRRADEPGGPAQGRRRRRLQERAREVPRRLRRDRGLPQAGQPVLVGTVSVEKSEVVASLLRKKGIPHNVLNAKQHEREAFIVAQAGRKGAVTISTNMAGRGTDIILGGNAEFMARAEVDPENAGKPGHELAPDKQAAFEEAFARFKAQCDPEKQEVLAAGGLHILGTERHESRRIDNQLRGRAGRQGDPGSSRFFLSLEDDLMRIFGAERITGLMERLGMEEDVPIEHGLINRAIENAQKKVEGHNFDIRKNLLEYDDVMNQQRKTIYALRRQILEGRYAPEPTEEEKKRGITASDVPPPAESGKYNRDRLAREIRPLLARMCEGLTEGAPPTRTRPTASVVTRDADPSFLRSAIYQQFGAYPDPKGILEDRRARSIAWPTRSAPRCSSSASGCSTCARRCCSDRRRHCPPNAHAEDWDLDALRARSRSASTSSPRSTRAS